MQTAVCSHGCIRYRTSRIVCGVLRCPFMAAALSPVGSWGLHCPSLAQPDRISLQRHEMMPGIMNPPKSSITHRMRHHQLLGPRYHHSMVLFAKSHQPSMLLLCFLFFLQLLKLSLPWTVSSATPAPSNLELIPSTTSWITLQMIVLRISHLANLIGYYRLGKPIVQANELCRLGKSVRKQPGIG